MSVKKEGQTESRTLQKSHKKVSLQQVKYVPHKKLNTFVRKGWVPRSRERIQKKLIKMSQQKIQITKLSRPYLKTLTVLYHIKKKGFTYRSTGCK